MLLLLSSLLNVKQKINHRSRKYKPWENVKLVVSLGINIVAREGAQHVASRLSFAKIVTMQMLIKASSLIDLSAVICV
jgi:hypothetical protein